MNHRAWGKLTQTNLTLKPIQVGKWEAIQIQSSVIGTEAQFRQNFLNRKKIVEEFDLESFKFANKIF